MLASQVIQLELVSQDEFKALGNAIVLQIQSPQPTRVDEFHLVTNITTLKANY